MNVALSQVERNAQPGSFDLRVHRHIALRVEC
jgi:hypothetical protein